MGLPFEAWAVIALIALVCATAILYTLAQYFGHEREIHDLKHRVITLRTAYHKRLANMNEIIEVDEAPDQTLPIRTNDVSTAKAA